MLEDFRLKVFMTVAETGSFTRAARILGITQPAVSQNIIALEKETGSTLFLRKKGEAILTDEGLTFKEYASQILYWYSATDEIFGKDGQKLSGHKIRIDADPVIADYLLSDVISAISSIHPENIFNVTSRKHEHFSKSGDVPGSYFGEPEDAELEISASPSPKTMDFAGESKLLGVMDAIVIASPQNNSLARAAVQEQDSNLSIKPFSTIAGIPVSNRFAVWNEYGRFFTPDLKARTVFTSDSIESVKSLVANSVSVAGIVPAISVRKEITSGTLLQMPVLLPDYSFDIHFNPLPEFAGKTICRLIRETLKNHI